MPNQKEFQHRPPPVVTLEELLPSQLVQDLLQVCDEEQAAILAHMAAIEAEIREYEAERMVIMEGTGALATEEQNKLQMEIGKLERRLKPLKSNLVAWRSRLGGVQAVRRAAASAKVSFVMTLPASWRTTQQHGNEGG